MVLLLLLLRKNITFLNVFSYISTLSSLKVRHQNSHTHIQTTVKNTVTHHSRYNEFLPGSASGLLVEKFRP